MSFATFADGSANLPNSLTEGITILSNNYTINDEPAVYNGNLDEFDAHAYYDMLRRGSSVKTSLLNTQTFLDAFRPVLEAGKDIIYPTMSSGISGTCQAAKMAALELLEEFPKRFIHIVDSKTCGLGTGMLCVRSAQLSREGKTAAEAAEILDQDVPHCCSYFTVDDLNFLKRTGRVSGVTAKIATVLNIKPILFGAADGIIISCAKVRGRKKAMEELIAKYREKIISPSEQTVYISHGDCAEDAETLADMVTETAKPKEIVICKHEPFSGSHVGPGMLALFFYGTER